MGLFNEIRMTVLVDSFFLFLFFGWRLQREQERAQVQSRIFTEWNGRGPEHSFIMAIFILFIGQRKHLTQASVVIFPLTALIFLVLVSRVDRRFVGVRFFGWSYLRPADLIFHPYLHLRYLRSIFLTESDGFADSPFYVIFTSSTLPKFIRT